MLPTLLRRSTCSTTSSVTPQQLPPLLWTYLPSHLPYTLGLTLQESLVQHRLSAKLSLQSPSLSSSQVERLNRIASTDILLLLQHTPVYTAGKREKDPITAQREKERLGKFGGDYVLTGRGGQTTFHGPGQLVGYPLIDLGQSKLSTRCYVDKLEKFLESLVESFNVPIHDLPHTGVFCSPTTKIASIGVQIRRRITMHGFSINVEEQTKRWFDQIIACGLEDVTSTSVEAELRRLGRLKEEEGVKVSRAVDRTVELFGKRYGREMRELREGDEHEEVRKMIKDGVEGRLGEVKREMMGV